MDLSIKPLFKTKKEKDPFPSPLPVPPFLWVCHAPPKSGKTHMILNILTDKRFGMSKYYDNIIFVSPTIDNHPRELNLLVDNGIDVVSDFENGLDEIIDRILEYQKKRDHPKTLIVLDDCLGLLGRKLGTLCSRYRHYNLSLIMTTQNFRSVDIVTRQCADVWSFFRTHSHVEKNKIIDELGGMLHGFAEKYDKATEKEFSFLYVNMQPTPAVFYKNLLEPLT